MSGLREVVLLFCCVFLGVSVASAAETETAIFAGGCFWSMQHDFESVPGVLKTRVGYTGGTLENPSYEDVSSGKTGHYEAIEIVYDPAKISYAELLNRYWHDTDPTDAEGQFCDHGEEYHPVIFYQNNTQKQIAEKDKSDMLASHRFSEIATQILPAQVFYPAEEYHQHYSDKNPIRYKAYRAGCQRDATLAKVWGR